MGPIQVSHAEFHYSVPISQRQPLLQTNWWSKLGDRGIVWLQQNQGNHLLNMVFCQVVYLIQLRYR